MRELKKLPLGIEDFVKIRKEGFYYIDKTGLIKELLNNWGEANLFTRPRRFGKSLNMNMLKTFFEYGCDARLFAGLEIEEEKELCKTYMGRFPVISVSLKDVGALNYETARELLCSVIGNEALRFGFLLESRVLSEKEKELYSQLIRIDASNRKGFIMPDAVLANSLLTLSGLLKKHYGKEAIVLIDEYDVPLDKAQQAGYYDEMVTLLRNLFSRVLKSNDSLYFAVLTGCLRLAKESIFTGLNHLNVLSITNVRYDGHFGFSAREVRQMLEYYGFEDKYAQVQEWYDGYRFGNADVYCPWDVVNYVNLLRADPDAEPEAFWVNTSGNEIIRRFIRIAKPGTRREIERLIEGGCVARRIKQDLTWRDLYTSIDNLWSVLFMTGYLSPRGKAEDGVYQLAIPNLAIRKIFIDQILEWFHEEVGKDAPGLDAFCKAFAAGDAQEVEKRFCAYLQKTISIRDTGVRKGRKETFYHGILLGLLSHREEWDIDSNAESGEGYCDILVETGESGIGIVVEVKYPENGNLEAGCEEALKQIREKGYESRLKEDGMSQILSYGIACWKKGCRVKLQTQKSTTPLQATGRQTCSAAEQRGI